MPLLTAAADGLCLAPCHAQLHILDEAAGCWWAVAPREDTLVLFRGERMLHRVCPWMGGGARYAVTMWFGEDPAEEERSLLASIVGGFM